MVRFCIGRLVELKRVVVYCKIVVIFILNNYNSDDKTAEEYGLDINLIMKVCEKKSSDLSFVFYLKVCESRKLLGLKFESPLLRFLFR